MAELAVPVITDAPDLVEGRTLSNRELLRTLLRKPLFVICGLVVLTYFAMAAVPRLFTSTDPRVCDLSKTRAGSADGHPFGFDVQGCDYLANVIYGARPSVLVSVVASVGVFTLAAVLGLLAGYFPGFVDGLISRTADVIFALPGLLALVVVLNTVEDRSIWIIVGVILLTNWPTGMRVMRATVFSVRNREFVLAARSVGVPPLRILRKHVFPNAMAPLLAITTLGVGALVSLEAALTFLGVGLQPPAISWGSQFGLAAAYRDTPHLFIWPALFISTMTISFMVIGDSIRDALDPKLLR